MKDTIEMAREAGYIRMLHGGAEVSMASMDCLKTFEALVRADEREECAKVCDEESNNFGGVTEGPFVTDFGKHTLMSMASGAQNCAAAIRAKGENK